MCLSLCMWAIEEQCHALQTAPQGHFKCSPQQKNNQQVNKVKDDPQKRCKIDGDVNYNFCYKRPETTFILALAIYEYILAKLFIVKNIEGNFKLMQKNVLFGLM